LAQERDERWVYIALAILAVAYAVYAFRDSIDLSRLSFDWIRKLGGTASYGLATVFAVAFQIWNKRRLERARKKWEESIKLEGFLREEPGVKVALSEGARGSFKADVQLTRSALYLFDRGARREPMRLPMTPSSARDSTVADVTLGPGAASGRRTVRVRVRGAAAFRIEFEAPDAEGWRTDLLRALGRSVRSTGGEEAAEPEEAWQE
jgi:hypothetical protein